MVQLYRIVDEKNDADMTRRHSDAKCYTMNAKTQRRSRMPCKIEDQTRTKSTNPKQGARMPKFVSQVSRRHA